MKTKDKCKVDGCKRLVAVKKHGLCEPHRLRYYRTGEVGSGKIRSYKPHKPFNKDIT
jgi:hypothetical protein